MKAEGWQPDYLETIGLEDMVERGNLPEHASPMGAVVGALTPEAPKALGLTTACHVGAGLIDAYAGALGVLGGFAGDLSQIDRHLALIAGTSSCLMALSQEPISFSGGWGPYYGVALPDCWLSEGGQSVTGALLDHIIRWHGAVGEPNTALHKKITERMMELREKEGPDLASRLHVLPDFHGNRSPLADPHAVGVISGLTLDASFDSLCRLYWRTCVGIALGVRHILDALNDKGYAIDTMHVTGGHTKSPLLMELYADATGCTVITSAAEDAVLLGTAMVAATAAGTLSRFAFRLHRNETGWPAAPAKPDRAQASRQGLPHFSRNACPAESAGHTSVIETLIFLVSTAPVISPLAGEKGFSRIWPLCQILRKSTRGGFESNTLSPLCDFWHLARARC